MPSHYMVVYHLETVSEDYTVEKVALDGHSVENGRAFATLDAAHLSLRKAGYINITEDDEFKVQVALGLVYTQPGDISFWRSND